MRCTDAWPPRPVAAVVEEEEQAGLEHDRFSNRLSSGTRTMLQCN